jgi:hypothetical protein
MTPINSPILKALVGSDAGLLAIDVIEFDNGLWLVTEWLENRDIGWQTPARIIRMDTIPHQKCNPAPHNHGANFVVNVSIPKAILSGADPTQAGSEFPLEVRDLPGVRVPSTTH